MERGTVKLRLRQRPRPAKELLPISRVLLRAHELFRSRRSGEDKVVVTPVGRQRYACLRIRRSLPE